MVVVGVMGIDLHGLLDPFKTLLRAAGVIEQCGEQHIGIGVTRVILDGLLRLPEGLYIFMLFPVGQTTYEVGQR